MLGSSSSVLQLDTPIGTMTPIRDRAKANSVLGGQKENLDSLINSSFLEGKDQVQDQSFLVSSKPLLEERLGQRSDTGRKQPLGKMNSHSDAFLDGAPPSGH